MNTRSSCKLVTFPIGQTVSIDPDELADTLEENLRLGP